MRKDCKHAKQRGLAVLELALLMPFVAALLLLLVEGANAYHVYSELSEASREGARLVLREGDGAGVPLLVQTIVEGLSGESPEVAVSMDGDGKAVTVEVSYAYQSLFGTNPALEALGDEPLTFRARTVMPLP